MADEPFAAPEIRRLEELRLEAAELAIGPIWPPGATTRSRREIDALMAEHPLRERSARAADAGAVSLRTPSRCARGLPRGAAHARRGDRRRTRPELRRLHEAILGQDPSLEVERAGAELPRELDAAASPPLAGRDAELALAARRAGSARTAGAGALVTLVGARGMGKTRLAAEIAGEAHREGATVLYVAGTGTPEAALAAIARAREPARPTLLVVDDADRARRRLARRDEPARRRVARRCFASDGHRPGRGARSRACDRAPRWRSAD